MVLIFGISLWATLSLRGTKLADSRGVGEEDNRHLAGNLRPRWCGGFKRTVVAGMRRGTEAAVRCRSGSSIAT